MLAVVGMLAPGPGAGQEPSPRGGSVPMECGGPEPPMAKSREMLRCAVGLCQGLRGAGVRTRGVVTGVVPMCMTRVEMWMDEPRSPPVCARLGGQPAVIRHGSCPFTHPPVLAERRTLWRLVGPGHSSFRREPTI